MSTTLTLVQRLDSSAAETLAQNLKSKSGKSVKIDASEVKFCGALALQILLSAHRQWQADKQSFEIDKPSQDMLEACRLMGVGPDEIGFTQEMGVPK